MVYYCVIWSLRHEKEPRRVTRHVYSGLTLEQAKRQAHVCFDNSIDALSEGFSPKVEIFKEDE